MIDNLKQFAKPAGEHVSLGRTLRGVIFVIPTAIVALLFSPSTIHSLEIHGARGGIQSLSMIVVGAFLWYVIVSGLRVAAEWERGVVLRLGKFQTVKGPGLLYIIPVLESVFFLDTRVLVLNIPRQKVITKDNVPAEIDAALFFMIEDSEKAVITIQDFKFAVAQYAQAALRDMQPFTPPLTSLNLTGQDGDREPC